MIDRFSFKFARFYTHQKNSPKPQFCLYIVFEGEFLKKKKRESNSKRKMFAILLSLSLSLIPVPNRPSGVRYGPADAQINIEIFLDMTCPDCATEFNRVKQILAAYPTQVNVVYHFFELPSHTWSYLLARSVFAVMKESEELGKKMLDGLLGNGDQSLFYPTTQKDNGEQKVYEAAKQYAVKQTGISASTFELNYDDLDVIMATRIEFKYSLIRDLPGTPTVYVNGVVTSLNEESTIDDWKDLINSLLQ